MAMCPVRGIRCRCSYGCDTWRRSGRLRARNGWITHAKGQYWVTRPLEIVRHRHQRAARHHQSTAAHRSRVRAESELRTKSAAIFVTRTSAASILSRHRVTSPAASSSLESSSMSLAALNPSEECDPVAARLYMGHVLIVTHELAPVHRPPRWSTQLPFRQARRELVLPFGASLYCAMSGHLAAQSRIAPLKDTRRVHEPQPDPHGPQDARVRELIELSRSKRSRFTSKLCTPWSGKKSAHLC